MIKKLAMMLLLAVFLVSCGDDSTSEAKRYELEKRLNDRDYAYIVKTLERSDGNYSSMSARNKYILCLAWFGQTGFNVLDNLDKFFGDDKLEGTALFTSFQAGSNNMNPDYVDGLLPKYAKIRNLVQNSGAVSNDLEMIGGIAGAMEILMNLTGATLTLINDVVGAFGGVLPQNILDEFNDTFSTLSLNEDDPNFVGKLFELFDTPEVTDVMDEAALLNLFEGVLDGTNGQGEAIIDVIVGNVDQIDFVASLLTNDDAQDVRDSLNEYIDALTDTDPTSPDFGDITTASVLNFLRNEIFKK